MKNIDLSKIFWSKCRTKIMEKFFLEYESWNKDWFHMRLLSRDLDEQINSVKRELDNLTTMWLLKHKTENRKKMFYINKNFYLMEEFKSIFLKSFNPFNLIKTYFKEQKQLWLIILNESLTTRLIENSNNIVDIFLIWEINKIEFNDFLSKTFFNRKIKYAIISEEDFNNRISYWDKLIKNILKQNWNLVFKDTIDAIKKIW